jgi:hypothetical protein
VVGHLLVASPAVFVAPLSTPELEELRMFVAKPLAKLHRLAAT